MIGSGAAVVVTVDLSTEILTLVWAQPLLLTLQLMAAAVSIAAVLGIVGAWAASNLQSAGRIGNAISRCFLVSMLAAAVMPMILHAAAWEATAGKFGWLIMTQTGARADLVNAYGAFGGLLACSWIHGLVGTAVVALATWHGTGKTPSAVIDQSRLDIGPLESWWRVRLPIAAPWVISALLATALLAATEMTVVDLYGYRTVADEFYLFYVVDPSIGPVLVTCFLPLAVCGGLLTWLLVSRRRLPQAAENHPEADAAEIRSSPGARLPSRWRWLLGTLAITLCCLVLVVPLGGLLVKLGHEVTVEGEIVKASWSATACLRRLFDAPQVFADEYRWTLIIAVVSGLVAAAIAWPVAAIGRTHRRAEHWIDATTVVMVAVPGPIVGLLVVSFFQLNLPGFSTLYQRTLVPTIMALLVRGLPVAYWVLRAGYRGIPTPVFEAARLEESWARRMWSIDRPLAQRSLVAAWLIAAVVASGDVPATLPVIPPPVSTVGTRLFGLLHSGARYQEAALAIWYVGAVVAISLVLIKQGFTSRVRVKRDAPYY